MCGSPRLLLSLGVGYHDSGSCPIPRTWWGRTVGNRSLEKEFILFGGRTTAGVWPLDSQANVKCIKALVHCRLDE